jgi:hypothetical protein
MRDKPLSAVRVTKGKMASIEADGMNGAFRVHCTSGRIMNVIVSDKLGWEHVSVSPFKGAGTPTWEEMCEVKGDFWDDEEVVIQYHPARSNYVNRHPNVLHLWKPIGIKLPLPPKVMV